MSKPTHPIPTTVNPSPVAVPWTADMSAQAAPVANVPINQPHPQAGMMPPAPAPIPAAPAQGIPAHHPAPQSAFPPPTGQQTVHYQQPQTLQPQLQAPIAPAPQQSAPQHPYAPANPVQMSPAPMAAAVQQPAAHAQYGQAYQPQQNQPSYASPISDFRASIPSIPAVESVATAPKSLFAKLLKRSPKVEMREPNEVQAAMQQSQMQPQPSQMVPAMPDMQAPNASGSLLNKNFALGAVTGLVIGAFVLPIILNMFVGKPAPQNQVLSQNETISQNFSENMETDSMMDTEGQTFLDAAIASEEP